MSSIFAWIETHSSWPVYALWKVSILPIISTAPVAIESLIGGSDLFIPGIFSVSSDSIPTGAAVAIASAQSPTVPLAVGRILLNSKDIKEEDKGKAVHVLHTWKDTLWQSGPKTDPPSELLPLRDALEGPATTDTSATDPGSDDKTGPAVGVDVAKLSLRDNTIEQSLETHTMTAEGMHLLYARLL